MQHASSLLEDNMHVFMHVCFVCFLVVYACGVVCMCEGVQACVVACTHVHNVCACLRVLHPGHTCMQTCSL